jgi:hypothetical protein
MRDQSDPSLVGAVILRLVDLGTPPLIAADLAVQTVTERSQGAVSAALRNGAASDLQTLFAALHAAAGEPS